MPFFEELVKGCFVRIGIGQNEGRSIYRVSLCHVYDRHVYYMYFVFLRQHFYFILILSFAAGCSNLGCCGNSQSVQLGRHKNKQRAEAQVRTLILKQL